MLVRPKVLGVSRIYNAPPETVWKTIPEILTDLGLQFVSDNKQEGYILAQRGMTAFSYGENVAIFIEAVDDVKMTRVEVISKKTMSTNIFAPNWENAILDKLDEKLKPPLIMNVQKPPQATPLAKEQPTDKKLEKLKNLYDRNLITKKEYDAERKKVLDKL